MQRRSSACSLDRDRSTAYLQGDCSCSGADYTEQGGEIQRRSSAYSQSHLTRESPASASAKRMASEEYSSMAALSVLKLPVDLDIFSLLRRR
jgi:hypothetical protein